MKNMVKKTLAILIIVSLVLAIAGCGGGGNSGSSGSLSNNPKTLAKQYMDTLGEMMKLHEANPNLSLTDPKLVELGKRTEEIEAKAGQMSEADKAIFLEEYQRLAGN